MWRTFLPVTLMLASLTQALALPDQTSAPRKKRPSSVALVCRVYGLWQNYFYGHWINYHQVYQCPLPSKAPVFEEAPLVCWCNSPGGHPVTLNIGYKAVYDPRLDLLDFNSGTVIKKGTGSP
jgi:hypothetical protein